MIAQLRSLVASVASNDEVRVVQYSSFKDCEILWAELQESSFLAAKTSTVILFDGEPREYRTNTSFHPEYWLSPWDWAIAASIRLSRNAAPQRGFRCLIFDLLPADWDASGRLRFKLLGSGAPWIRSYSPISTNDYRRAFSDIQCISALPIASPISFTTTDWRLLTQAWRALFEAPPNRHSIGNLIAPLLLVDGLYHSRGLSISIAADHAVLRFYSLIKSVGLANYDVRVDRRSSSANILGEAEFSAPKSDPFERYQKIHVWLVDDQYRLGYHTILGHLLLGKEYQEIVADDRTDATGIGNPGVRLSSIDSPSMLLQALKVAVKTDRGRLHEFGNGEIDILCLDLRLFADSTTSRPSEHEQAFLKELIKICRESQMQSTSPQMAAALRAAQRRADGGVEELSSLCLLPLMINKVDPSLPLVLFSSTHQREVTDAFKSHPSIITTFSKPIFAGYSVAELTKQCTRDLQQAMREALRLHRIRDVWSALCRFEKAIGTKFLMIKEPALESSTGASAFALNRNIVPYLASEYQNLLLTGRFADALQVPDNILEYIRGRFMAPSILRNMDIVFLDSLRDNTRSWESALVRADSDINSREVARYVLKHSIENLGKFQPRDVQSATRAFAKAVSESYQSGVVNLAKFQAERRSISATLTARYRSLGDAVHSALDRALGDAHSKLARLEQDSRPLTSFQFFAPIAAMRNARSHFKCRPLEHDEELQPIAIWTWVFFLEGLQSLVMGQKPIVPRLITRKALHEAAAGRSFPTANLLDHMDGSEFCYQVIAHFGHLLRLGILNVHPSLAPCAQHAKGIVDSLEEPDTVQT